MGVYLSEPSTAKNTVKGELGKLSFASSEMQGWRRNMEDAAIHDLDIGDGNSLFAVFDGHGGQQVSEYVRQIFVSVLKATSQYNKKNYVAALDLTFKKVDQMIISEQGSKKLKAIRSKTTESDNMYEDRIANGTGCTANVVLITPEHYIIANAGDSRSVLCRGGKALPLSEDHKPENYIESKRIQNAGGVITMGRVNGGLNLTRSFGDFDYKQNKSLGYDEQMITCKPDIKQVARETGDEFILLGCDGIWQRYVDESQGLIDIVRKECNSKQLTRVVEDMLDFLLAKDTREGIGCDNMTAILVKFK